MSERSTLILNQLTAADLQTFRAFLLEKAKTCLHRADGILKYTFVTPSYQIKAGADDQALVSERSTTGHYLQMYDWDSCFFSEMQSALGMDHIAKDVVFNFLSLKEADGYVPRTVSPNKIWDRGDVCKPFLCQALLKGIGPENIKNALPSGLIEDLECYLDYFNRYRRHSSGLFHWHNMLESGVDDNVSLIAPRDAAKDENKDVGLFSEGTLLAVDLSSYLVAEYEALSQMADAAGRPVLAKKYAQSAQDLVVLIEKYFWSESLGLYCNLDTLTNQHVAIRSWTGLTPVLFGFAQSDRVKKTIEECILAPRHFLRPFGLSSLAASELLYNQAKRGLYGRAMVSNWQGPVWVLPNVLTVRALFKYGYNNQAVDLARRVLSAMISSWKRTGTTYENYDAETGQPLWAPQFMSWNILALELIQLAEA